MKKSEVHFNEHIYTSELAKEAINAISKIGRASCRERV